MIKQIQNLTIGIEEEYQLIDPKTRELTSYISEILEQGSLVFKDEVKPELLQSQIEIGSQVCNNIDELKTDLVRLRKLVSGYAAKQDLSIIAAGTHPFSHCPINTPLNKWWCIYFIILYKENISISYFSNIS